MYVKPWFNEKISQRILQHVQNKYLLFERSVYTSWKLKKHVKLWTTKSKLQEEYDNVHTIIGTMKVILNLNNTIISNNAYERWEHIYKKRVEIVWLCCMKLCQLNDIFTFLD